MDANKFHSLVVTILKTRGINDFKITKMSIEDRNYSVAENGVLCYEKHIDVTVQPTMSIEKITIAINITPDGINFD